MNRILYYPSNEEVFALAILNKLKRIVKGSGFLSQQIIDLFIIDLNVGTFQEVCTVLITLNLFKEILHGVNQYPLLLVFIYYLTLVFHQPISAKHITYLCPPYNLSFHTISPMSSI